LFDLFEPFFQKKKLSVFGAIWLPKGTPKSLKNEAKVNTVFWLEFFDF
jgi:hypothetical protein